MPDPGEEIYIIILCLFFSGSARRLVSNTCSSRML